MGLTNLDSINATTARAKVLTATPGTPMLFYGFTAGQDVGVTAWQGGEIYYNSTDYKLYVQTATSGTGAGTWVATTDTFVTSSTSTSTTTSSSSTSSSTTTTSTTTSTTTTSTSSSSTSSSTTTTA